jgi:hypothetical protein
MNMKSILIAALAFGFIGFAHAEDSTSDKAETTGNDVKRDVKKKWHHTEEAVCQEGDAKCLAKKAKHRATEGKDYVKDKTNEAVDKSN